MLLFFGGVWFGPDWARGCYGHSSSSSGPRPVPGESYRLFRNEMTPLGPGPPALGESSRPYRDDMTPLGPGLPACLLPGPISSLLSRSCTPIGPSLNLPNLRSLYRRVAPILTNCWSRRCHCSFVKILVSLHFF